MSLFSWLSPRKPKPQAENSVIGRTEPNRLAAGAPDPGTRKSERMARRELLYSVVRESMARAGVLSASYKFKVLSLDSAGRQFLVMVDLAPSERASTDLLADIEAGVMQRAKARHDLSVTAVYWRRNDQVGVAQRPAPPRPDARVPAAPSQPAELESEPAPLQSRAAGSSDRAGFDPIMDEEMAAFKAALAAAKAGGPRSAETTPRPGPGRSRDFEATQVRGDEPHKRTLSPTQSGDLN
jgi:hypothetical protein